MMSYRAPWYADGIRRCHDELAYTSADDPIHAKLVASARSQAQALAAHEDRS